jgi:hypothetical protein
MTTVAIVYHSGFGHTKALAEAVAAGARTVPQRQGEPRAGGRSGGP